MADSERPFDPEVPPERYARPHHFAVNGGSEADGYKDAWRQFAGWGVFALDSYRERNEPYPPGRYTPEFVAGWRAAFQEIEAKLRSGVDMLALRRDASARYHVPGPPPDFTANRAEADPDMADELVLYIDNTAELVGDPSQGWSIVLNLLRKLKKGTYDHARAPVLWGYLAEAGAKRYSREMQSDRSWNVLFSKPTRDLAAQQLADDFLQRYEAGDFQDVDIRIRR